LCHGKAKPAQQCVCCVCPRRGRRPLQFPQLFYIYFLISFIHQSFYAIISSSSMASSISIPAQGTFYSFSKFDSLFQFLLRSLNHRSFLFLTEAINVLLSLLNDDSSSVRESSMSSLKDLAAL
jgi:hypothetical protein